MKKSIIALLLCLCSFCLILSGCTGLTMPTGSVSSNGGGVVSVGDYIYFAGMFKDYSSLKDGDNKNNEKESALYRINVKDGIVKNDDGEITNAEVISNKVVGSQASNLYVVGDYIYFTTPNVLKTSTDETRFDLSTLMKVRLDGEKQSEIHTTIDASAKFYFANLNNQDYCFIYEDGKLVKITLGNDSVKTIDLNGNSIVFDVNNNGVAYFTTARSDNNGNILKKINLISENIEVVYNQVGTTFTLNALFSNVLYYQKATTYESAYYYFNDFSSNSSEQRIISATSITDEKPVANTINNGRVVCYIFETNLYIKIFGDNNYSNIVITSEDDCGTPTNILHVSGDNVFFKTENGIFMVSYKNGIVKKVSDKVGIKTTNIDFDGRYLYFYSLVSISAENDDEKDKETTNYYLHRADTHFANENGDNLKTEYIKLAEIGEK